MSAKDEKDELGLAGCALTGAGVGAAGVGTSAGMIGVATSLAVAPVAIAMGVAGGLVYWVAKSIIKSLND